MRIASREMGSAALSPEVLGALTDLLAERVTTSPSVVEQHGRDESPLRPAAPDAVAFPESTAEVSAIARLCNQYRVPMIPFGAGTSLEGHVLAPSGGLSVDLTRMNEITAVRPHDLDATVQAGVTRKALNDRLARDGLFFPVDPGADATIGGMAATGASGTTTVRYGAMRDNVLGLEIVLADGTVVQTARRARKSSAGYDLTRLFVGSEGTLGVITEVTLRAYGIPDSVSCAICRFQDVEAAVDAVIATMQLGIGVARIELLDELSIQAINAYAGAEYPVAPLLLLEFHGSSNEVADQTDAARAVATEYGAVDFRSAEDAAERQHLWRARHAHFYASRALRPGGAAMTTDVCVPLSALAACICKTQDDIAELRLTATIAGHVGDGNFHVVVLIDPEDQDEVAAAEEMNGRLVERALEMDGTCTGEHGIGIRKKRWLRQELGGAVDLMSDIKRTLDPNNILNPGKVIDSI